MKRFCYNNAIIWRLSAVCQPGVDFIKDSFNNFGSLSESSRQEEICCITTDDQDLIRIGCRNGIVKTFDGCQSVYVNEMQIDSGSSPIRGLSCTDAVLVSCSEDGNIKAWNEQKLKQEKRVGDHVCCFGQSTTKRQLVATGGKENNLKVWDIEDMKSAVYIAKNVRHDELELRVPVWVTGISFMTDTTIATSTGYSQVRVYDTRAKRRPTLDMKWEEHPITSLSLSSDANCFVVGNTVGSMAAIDARTGKVLGSYKGIAGGIRAVQCHKDERIVACVGLDRFIRFYNLDSRVLIRKMYLKSKLSCLLLSKDTIKFTEEDLTKDSKIDVIAKQDNDQKDEGDDLWDNMTRVDETAALSLKKKGRKRKLKPS